MYNLTRMKSDSFQCLLDQWKPHFGNDENLLYEHCRPHLEHAKGICDEDPPDPRYGIYALTSSDGEDVFYEGFTHINHKLPSTKDSEVRLVWNTLHPKYENELTPKLLAEFTLSYIIGAIVLAKGELSSESVRIYLGNATDRRYAEGIVVTMRDDSVEATIEMAGNWLHINGVSKIKLP